MSEAGETLDLAVDAPSGALDSQGRRLLTELVATPSESGEEDAVAELLQTFFERHGRDTFVDAVGNVRAPGDDAVLLTSHLDTVPGGPEVRVVDGDDEFAVEGPVLHGRGSVDATGALAAMAVAAVETGVSFVGVVAEETDSTGARYLLADRSAPEAVVNGEPSGWDALTLGYRGLIAGEYTVTTTAAHGSRPEANAIDYATGWWEAVRGAVEGDDDSDNAAADAAVFDDITATATSIGGGLAAGGDAVEASLDVQFRVPPSETPESVRDTVEECLTVGSLSWHDAIPPHVADPRSSLAAALRRAIRAAGGEPTHLHKSGTADANLFADSWDVPVVTYGPGDSSLDHAPDERLPLAAFDQAIDVLATAVAQLVD
jgi:LysW-gamma-L-lysine carboxypeptidase